MVTTESPPLVVPGAAYAFGASPFHVKGVLYQGTQAFFEKKVAGGLPRLLREMGPGPLADFLGQRFLPSSRYDVMPVPALIHHEAAVLNQSVQAYLQARTRWQAEQDLRGAYRLQLALVSPDTVASRLPRIMMQMFTFSRVTTESPAPRTTRVHVHGVPRPLAEWLNTSLMVYARYAMEQAGAATVFTHHDSPTPDGTESGIPLVALHLRLSWV